MKIFYKADDGSDFEDRDACIRHEANIEKAKRLAIVLFDARVYDHCSECVCDDPKVDDSFTFARRIIGVWERVRKVMEENDGQ